MLLKLIKFDVLFQFRQGFYLVYGILTAIYVLFLLYLPPSGRMAVTAYLILSDTSVLGLIFIGAIVLLEKQQNILQSLFVTPLKLSTYLWSKGISLTLIAVSASSIIGFLPGGLSTNWGPTLISVLLTSLFFTFIGLGISARVNTLNGYIAGIITGGFIFSGPVALYYHFPEYSVFFPINAAIDLLIKTSETQTVFKLLADTISLAGWNIAGFYWAKRQFVNYVIQK